MFDRTPAFRLIAFISVFNAASLLCFAQQQQLPPVASPSPSRAIESEEQDPIRVHTQEVRLPIVAYDEHERFDPTLAPDDVLVVEDGVPQQVRSVRRVPANILLVFDLGSPLTATRTGQAARAAAHSFIQTLRPGHRLAVIQNSGRVELLQDWTTETNDVSHVLKTKLFPATRSRLTECLMLAANKLQEQPVGNTHVIVFTDGLEAQTRNEIRSGVIPKEALQNLAATQASVHIFGFAAMVEGLLKERDRVHDIQGRGDGSVSVVVDTDFEMRRWFKNYARAAKQRQEQLHALAQETGGRLLLPASTDEVVERAGQVARDIGAQYVVTYSPKRPFAPDADRERRRINVSARRIGLQLFSLRSYVTNAAEVKGL